MIQDSDEADRSRDDTRQPPSISDGLNARPRNETVASTGIGLPNDASAPVELSREDEQRIETAIRNM